MGVNVKQPYVVYYLLIIQGCMTGEEKAQSHCRTQYRRQSEFAKATLRRKPKKMRLRLRMACALSGFSAADRTNWFIT